MVDLDSVLDCRFLILLPFLSVLTGIIATNSLFSAHRTGISIPAHVTYTKHLFLLRVASDAGFHLRKRLECEQVECCPPRWDLISALAQPSDDGIEE